MNAKWKRLVTAILMMALLLGPIVSMQTPARAADGEDDNTFIVGFDAEFPPYGYKDDNGEYVASIWIWHRRYATGTVGH